MNPEKWNKIAEGGMCMKRILWLLLFLCFALAPAPVWAETNAENAPQIAAQGAALVDGRTGRVLWEKDGDTPKIGRAHV